MTFKHVFRFYSNLLCFISHCFQKDRSSIAQGEWKGNCLPWRALPQPNTGNTGNLCGVPVPRRSLVFSRTAGASPENRGACIYILSHKPHKVKLPFFNSLLSPSVKLWEFFLAPRKKSSLLLSSLPHFPFFSFLNLRRLQLY